MYNYILNWFIDSKLFTVSNKSVIILPKKDSIMKFKTLFILTLLLLSACSHPTKLSIAKMHIVGVWHEKSATPDAIGELIFRDDGTFTLAKSSFDVSKDYCGTYTIDPKKRRLHLTITEGTNIPKDANINDFHYSYNSNSELILTNGYFGTFNCNILKKERYQFIRGYQQP